MLCWCNVGLYAIGSLPAAAGSGSVHIVRASAYVGAANQRSPAVLNNRPTTPYTRGFRLMHSGSQLRVVCKVIAMHIYICGAHICATLH